MQKRALVITASLTTAGAVLVILAWPSGDSAVLAQAKTEAVARVDFESMPAGMPPTGFSFARTGEGTPSRWIVESVQAPDGTSKVLVQTAADRTSYRFPLAIYEDFSGSDVALSVRFRAMSGEVDQAAGLVWRYRDADNYYVVRANALEDNVVLYKMQNGRRSDLKPVGSSFLAYGAGAEVPQNAWSTLEITAVGSRFAVFLNGKPLYEVVDDTFAGAGKAGLWTKADSVTQFDDFSIASATRQ